MSASYPRTEWKRTDPLTYQDWQNILLRITLLEKRIAMLEVPTKIDIVTVPNKRIAGVVERMET